MIPDRMNPLTIIIGLSSKYLAISTSHFAPTSLSTDRLRSICSSSRLYVHILQLLHNLLRVPLLEFSPKEVFFAGLLTEMSIGWSKSVVLGGSKHTWMSRSSRRVLTEGVTWPLKLSMIMSAGFLSLTNCQTLSTYGMMILLMYRIMVSSVDQYLGEWVMSHPEGNWNFGWQRGVFSW